VSAVPSYNNTFSEDKAFGGRECEMECGVRADFELGLTGFMIQVWKFFVRIVWGRNSDVNIGRAV
jgi:hypothetical protein